MPPRVRALWRGARAAAAGSLALWCCVAAGESAGLPQRAATIEGFVPPGWVIEQRHRADLDRDGVPDAVLLLRQNDPAFLTRTPGGGTLDTNPRRLAVLRGTRAPRGFVLAGESARLIPRTDDPNLEDPMADGEITAHRGGFEIKLSLLAGYGTYASRVVVYHFRLEPRCVRLARYVRMDTHRATLATQDLRVDYLAGRIERVSGNAQTDANRVTRERMARPPRLCLEALPGAREFEPL